MNIRLKWMRRCCIYQDICTDLPDYYKYEDISKNVFIL